MKFIQDFASAMLVAAPLALAMWAFDTKPYALVFAVVLYGYVGIGLFVVAPRLQRPGSPWSTRLLVALAWPIHWLRGE